MTNFIDLTPDPYPTPDCTCGLMIMCDGGGRCDDMPCRWTSPTGSNTGGEPWCETHQQFKDDCDER